jgi:hypothetical protein
MRKPLEVSDMPPLTEDMHRKLRKIERDLGIAFGNCCHSYDLNDREAAFEYARTFSINFFDCYYEFYSKIPDPAYSAHWLPASERFAFQRVVKCIENQFAIRDFFNRNPDRVDRIKRTIADHAKGAAVNQAQMPTRETQQLALTGRQAANYARSGIDLNSASPLLMMAIKAAQESGKVFPPEKQRSTLTRRRIPRSIYSESAAKRLEDHLNAKGLSQTQFAIEINVDVKTLYRFRKTGRVGKSVAQIIAKAMGKTLEEFIVP